MIVRMESILRCTNICPALRVVKPLCRSNCTTSSASSTPAAVTYETQGTVAIISLCQPASRNAIDVHLNERLDEAIGTFEADATVHVGVLFGTGGSFSAGTNMKSAANLWRSDDERGRRRHFAKPMVCGISGYCVGSGLELALACDLRVIEEDACLGFFNRRYGVPLTDGACQRLPALIGMSRALDLILTGRPVGGKEALELGLANRLVATGTALGQAVTLAKSIAKHPQASLLFDRTATLTAAHGRSSFNQEQITEAMQTEMMQGLELFKTGRRQNGKTTNSKQHEMADWEIAEYNIELKSRGK